MKVEDEGSFCHDLEWFCFSGEVKSLKQVSEWLSEQTSTEAYSLLGYVLQPVMTLFPGCGSGDSLDGCTQIELLSLCELTMKIATAMSFCGALEVSSIQTKEQRRTVEKMRR